MMRDRLGDYGFRFDLDFDLGSFLKLYLFSVRIGETIWNTDLSIEVICPLDGDLSFLRFTRTGMRMNYLFDPTWERSACLGPFTRHVDPPLRFRTPFTHSRHKPVKRD